MARPAPIPSDEMSAWLSAPCENMPLAPLFVSVHTTWARDNFYATAASTGMGALEKASRQQHHKTVSAELEEAARQQHNKTVNRAFHDAARDALELLTEGGCRDDARYELWVACRALARGGYERGLAARIDAEF